tara:strand:+ start:861 stop:1082 length:222 start_codon:yes stop_codon:yes gene_type:complete
MGSVPSKFMTASFPILSQMIHSKKMILDVIAESADIDTLDRTQKFMVFCNVCDNLLEDGRITKANHKKWTEIV